MSKELLLVAEALSNEKGVSKEVVLGAIQAALESATRKLIGQEFGIQVTMDPRLGDYATIRYWDVVADDEIEFTDRQLTLAQAQARKPDAQLGDRIEEHVPSIEFGRIAAQTARHVIFQKIREAERRMMVDQFKAKIGQLVYGTVKKVTRDNIIVDLGGKAEAFLARADIHVVLNY